MTSPKKQPDRYLDRIERVRTHIRDNLDAPLDLDTLADVACLSRFHWTRIYQAMTGESPVETVRRLRLERAARDLATGDADLHRLAIRSGYTSQSAFTRAFAIAYGMPPATFRSSGLHAELAAAIKEQNAMAFPIDLRTLPTRPAIGLEHRGPYHGIGATFGLLFSELARANLTDHVVGIFGRYLDDPKLVAPADLHSHACAFIHHPVTAPAPLVTFEACGGLHAVLTYKGPYSAMQPAYDWLFGVWLPQSGRVPRDAPCLEINLNTPDTTPPQELLTEICLPLEE
jgi:AraC family transcriptional regulator